MSDHSLTKAGTMGGMLTVLLANISSGEITRTAMLSAIGAVVSYLVSLGIKWLTGKFKRGHICNP